MVNIGEMPASEYGVLAEHYDSVYGAARDNRLGEIALTTGLVKSFRPDARTVLDLGTGTGVLLAGFRGQVEELVGLDISPEMLAVARRQVPEAEFIEADMSDFNLDRQFDAIICFFDSINHLKNFDQWKTLFKRVEEHLTDKGVFVFDVATSGLVRRLAAGEYPTSWPVEGGSYALDIKPTDSNNYVVHFTFDRDSTGNGAAETITGDIHEATYPVEDIKAAAGEHLDPLLDFEAVNVLVDQLLVPATDDSRHPVFVYGKP